MEGRELPSECLCVHGFNIYNSVVQHEGVGVKQKAKPYLLLLFLGVFHSSSGGSCMCPAHLFSSLPSQQTLRASLVLQVLHNVVFKVIYVEV